MRGDVPGSVLESAHQLSVDALVKLFSIELRDGTVFRLSPQIEVTWLGDLYEEIPCHMTGVGQNTDGTAIRPKFSFANPNGLFSSELQSGRMNNATVTRHRVLRADLDADRDVAIRESFRVSRIVNIGKHMAAVELRDVLDGQSFRLPARSYMPPEFPHVRLR